MYPDAERGEERRELDVESSESERLRLRTIVAVRGVVDGGIGVSGLVWRLSDELKMKR